MAEQEALCLFQLPDGSVQCASCAHPPADSVYLRVAPLGLEEGTYEADDPRFGDSMNKGGSS